MEALKDEIARRSEPIEGISALLVFGSRARGTERPDSDLDVAVLPSIGDDPKARRKLQTRLAVALADFTWRSITDAPTTRSATTWATSSSSPRRWFLCLTPDELEERRSGKLRQGHKGLKISTGPKASLSLWSLQSFMSLLWF
jgi:hypothetical protein